MTTRRTFVLGGAMLAVPLPALAQGPRPLLLMMSAEDCPPCNAWKMNVLPEWRKTDQFARVDFKVIEGYRIRSLDNPGTWMTGKEYLPIYKAFLADMPRWTASDKADVGFVNDHTAPRWFIVVDGKLQAVAVSWRRISAQLEDALGLQPSK
jgi:hypothetical protein